MPAELYNMQTSLSGIDVCTVYCVVYCILVMLVLETYGKEVHREASQAVFFSLSLCLDKACGVQHCRLLSSH